MLKYSKNFVLSGDIDFFCLICNESFELPEEVEKHIRWEQHRKLLKGQECLPKFKKDGVYKLGDKYFCEVCSYVTSAFNTIKSHIKEEKHKTKKENPDTNEELLPLVKRDLDFVIVSETVLTKKEWHGVINNQCLICNTAANNFSIHAASPAHMIRLIKARVVKQNEQYYRKINDDTFFCFKCKKILSDKFLTNHCTLEEHTTSVSTGENKGVKLIFEIDKEKCTATCVVCHETLFWSYTTLEAHRNKHIEKGEWVKDDKEKEHIFMQILFQDHGKLRSNLKKFGNDNFIKMNRGGSKGYCTLCNTHISAHISNFKQHVEGVRHNNFLELNGIIKKAKKTEKPNYKTKLFMDFFQEVILVKSAGVFLVPSAELCISLISFSLMAHIDENNVVCFICNGTYPDFKAHMNKEHSRKMFATHVITSLKNEFVREIRPGLYHCGICNMTYAGWAVLEKHFNLFKHKYANLQAHKMIEDLVGSRSLGTSGSNLNSSDLADFKKHFPF